MLADGDIFADRAEMAAVVSAGFQHGGDFQRLEGDMSLCLIPGAVFRRGTEKCPNDAGFCLIHDLGVKSV